VNTIELEKHVNSPDVSKFEGTTAIFFPIDDQWGVKLFRIEKQRNLSYNRHATLYDMGLAPMYGPKNTLVYNGEVLYGYLCEIVECCDTAVLDYYGMEHDGKCQGENYFELCARDSYSDFLMENEKWGTAEVELRGRLEEEGINFTDTHAGNWGIRKNGQPVLIDFDKGLYELD